MRFRQCRRCTFWVRRKEDFCPNCGVHQPYRGAVSYRVLAVGLTIVAGGLVGSTALAGGAGGRLAFFGMFGGSVIGLGFWTGLFAYVRRMIDHAATLEAKEKALTDRLRQVDSFGRHIKELQEEIEPRRNPARARRFSDLLLDAQLTVGDYRKRTLSQLALIDTVRWHNKLAPLAAAEEDLSVPEVRRRLQLVKTLREGGKRMAANWRRSDLDDAAARLHRLLERCDQIEDRLVTSQATAIARACADLPFPDDLVGPDHQLLDWEPAEPDGSQTIEALRYEIDRLEANRAIDREFPG